MEAKINLNIGELPDQPGIKSYMEIISGVNSIAQAKERASAEIGHDVSPYNIYAVIGCSSVEGAIAIKEHLAKIWTKLRLDWKNDYRFGKFFSSFVGCNPEEDINVHETSVIIHGFSSRLEFGNSSDEEKVDSNEQTILIEMDVGQELITILRGDNPIVDSLNALRLKMSMNRSSSIPEDIWDIPNHYCQNLERFARFLLPILKSGDLELNFKSASELPELVKEEAKNFIEDNRLLIVVVCVMFDWRNLFEEHSEHTTGEFYGFWHADSQLKKVKIHAPGLFTSHSTRPRISDS